MVKNAVNDLGQVLLNGVDLIVNGLKSVLELFFVPSNNLFDDFTDLLQERFGFVYQVIELVQELKAIEFDNAKPSFTVKLNSNFFGSLKGQEFEIIDFSMYAQYRTFIHSIIVVITDFFFFMYILREIPAVVGGITSGVSMFRREDEVDYSILGNRSNSYDYF